MGNGWGTGARSALPMVGEFFQQALRAKVLDTALLFDAPKFTRPANRWNNSEESEEAEPLQAEESGIQNGDMPPGGAEQADPVFRDDQPYPDESGAMPPENLPPQPVVRYITVPPPEQDRQRLPPEGQAMLRAYEVLPPEERRRPRPMERAPQTIQGNADEPASSYGDRPGQR
jgi:penicillin-binding protein 1A